MRGPSARQQFALYWAQLSLQVEYNIDMMHVALQLQTVHEVQWQLMMSLHRSGMFSSNMVRSSVANKPNSSSDNKVLQGAWSKEPYISGAIGTHLRIEWSCSA